MTWRMVYSTFIVSFSGGKPTKKLSNICSVWATFVLVQLSAPCDQLDHELISIYLIDYNHMKTFDNAGNIAPNHVSIWYIQFAYNVTLYLTVPCIAGQRAPLSTHILHSERPPAFKLYFVLKAGPYLVFRASKQRGALNANWMYHIETWFGQYFPHYQRFSYGYSQLDS